MRFKIYISVCIAGLTMLVWSASAATSTVERIASAGKIEASCDFEKELIPPVMKGAYEAPLSVQKGEGALGSAGFLRVGPHTFPSVGARIHVVFTVTEDTWLGFSARKEGGGGVGVLFADLRQNKNVTANVEMPDDGSWGTFRINVDKIGMSVGTPVQHISFFVANRMQAPVAFYLDNICLGHGRPADIPSAPVAVNGQTTNDMVTITWQAPSSACGLMEYRVYRGFHPDFARDERRLVGQVQKRIFFDSTFARPTTYYYAVRVVDFAGNESQDTGATALNLTEAK